MKLKVFLSVFLCLGLVGLVQSQCPMCRMTLESNLANGGSSGLTINAGILYMLIMPYLLVGTIGYLWYKNNKKIKSA